MYEMGPTMEFTNNGSKWRLKVLYLKLMNIQAVGF